MTRTSAASPRRLLRIYLNDHLMGATAMLHLSRRCLSSNSGTPLGSFLEGLITELDEDRTILVDLMDALHLTRAPVKQAAAVVGERIGRAKLNGSLTGYSDLSRLVELEGLLTGATLQLALWRSLQQIAAAHPPVGALDLDRLAERATAQIERLETHRREAVAKALT